MQISKIWFDDKNIFLQTAEGIEQSIPLKWFPRLENASKQQKDNYELSAYGIHWEDIDEDLSFAGFFEFNKSKVNNPVLMA